MTAGGETLTVARNVSTRYLAIAVEIAVGLLLLPLNVAHLGTAAYGLWVLTASVTAYFSVLDLGYSGALVKFVASYRARQDHRALNEILSTMFTLFTSFGVLTYVVAIVAAIFLDRLFNLDAGQLYVGRIVLLVISAQVALGMAFSVFGAVANGFQRYDLNNIVGAVSGVVVGLTNIGVLLAGFGLIELVAATTFVRLVTLWAYRANAYRVLPALRLDFRLFSRARLREVTGFSVYMLCIDWAYKLNYQVDTLVVGAFLNTSAVAVWAVAQRLAEGTQRLTIQMSDMLFPSIVDHDESQRTDRLQAIFLLGTRLSLAAVVPVATALLLMAHPLVTAWVGPELSDSALIVQLLALTVVLRVGTSTSSMVLKGAGRHQLVAVVNVAIALVNISLSIVLVRLIGLVGVAIGTLIPLAIGAVAVIFPAGCRRVGLSVRHVLAISIWPAVWPASVMAVYLAMLRPFAESLATVAVVIGSAIAVYAATFFLLGISAAERRFFLSKAAQLTAQVRLQLAAVSGHA